MDKQQPHMPLALSRQWIISHGPAPFLGIAPFPFVLQGERKEEAAAPHLLCAWPLSSATQEIPAIAFQDSRTCFAAEDAYGPENSPVWCHIALTCPKGEGLYLIPQAQNQINITSLRPFLPPFSVT